MDRFLRIGRAKGVARSFVAMRLQLAEMPEPVLDAFVNNESLNERMALEIVRLSTVDNLSAWYSREQVLDAFVTNESLNEGMAREIVQLSHCDNLSAR
jgi:hypothetical protein